MPFSEHGTAEVCAHRVRAKVARPPWPVRAHSSPDILAAVPGSVPRLRATEAAGHGGVRRIAHALQADEEVPGGVPRCAADGVRVPLPRGVRGAPSLARPRP